jgi:hypothetical protein
MSGRSLSEAGASGGVLVEDFTPYDRSALWRLNEIYYSERGAAAFNPQGSIPYFATSALSAAKRAARLVAAVVRAQERDGTLGPEDEVQVLEVGCGHGRFATNLFRALRATEAGRALARRIRYALTDYVAATVEGAARSPGLAPLVRARKVVPAALDVTRPEDGLRHGIGGRPLVAAFASYVCCAVPLKVIRKTATGFEEKWIALVKDAPGEWRTPAEFRRVRLEETLSDPVHAQAIRTAVEGLPEATVLYPQAFLDFARVLGARMRPGGLLVVNDFGEARAAALAGLRDPPMHVYGGETLNHPVQFAVFDAFARAAGLSVLRTRVARGGVHTVALRYARTVPGPLRRVFAETYGARARGRDLVDLALAGDARFRKGDLASAARLYRECLKIDPECPEVMRDLGTTLVAAGDVARGRRWLEKARLRLNA